jgi:hypothetical protein
VVADSRSVGRSSSMSRAAAQVKAEKQTSVVADGSAVSRVQVVGGRPCRLLPCYRSRDDRWLKSIRVPPLMSAAVVVLSAVGAGLSRLLCPVNEISYCVQLQYVPSEYVFLADCSSFCIFSVIRLFLVGVTNCG